MYFEFDQKSPDNVRFGAKGQWTAFSIDLSAYTGTK